MYFASVNNTPLTPVFPILSDLKFPFFFKVTFQLENNNYPAKSTKCNFAFLIVADPVSLAVTCMVKIQCDRVEA